MKLLALFAAALLATVFTAISADKDSRFYEMRTYYAAPGKLDDLNTRFRDHTTKLFEKHGITNIGYWVPIENPDNKLVYVLAYPSREARDKSWKEFGADPEWKKVSSESEANGKLVAKVEQIYMTATDFSPEIKPAAGTGERVFELRTYTTTPGNLPTLHARFRDHTLALFAKHGMTNVAYWQLTPEQPKWKDAASQPNPENTLIYMLAHASVEPGKKSFEAFRADPDWIAAKKASEEKGGGSLTVPDGVKSVLLKATDYSPIK